MLACKYRQYEYIIVCLLLEEHPNKYIYILYIYKPHISESDQLYFSYNPRPGNSRNRQWDECALQLDPPKASLPLRLSKLL